MNETVIEWFSMQSAIPDERGGEDHRKWFDRVIEANALSTNHSEAPEDA